MALIASRRIAQKAVRAGNTGVHSAVGNLPDALLAAGQIIKSDDKTKASSGNGQDDWKQQAWAFLDQVGELSYVCRWLANGLSRCTIKASDLDPETGQPTGETEDQLASDLVKAIAGGPAGQAEMFSRMATHFTVPGEFYLAIIYRDQKDPGTGLMEGREEWHILSTDEVKKSSGKIEIDLPDGSKHEINDADDLIAKVHRPHPRRASESDSPTRAAIPILREIVRLGQHIEATAKSRLAGAGLVVLPNELSMPVANAPTGQRDPDAPGLPAPDPGQLPQQTTRSVNANDVLVALVEAASTAIQDPSAAAALVPLALQAPGEFLDKIKHLTFGSEFTEVVLKLREAAIKRLALTIDVPPEILLGLGGVNHWGAWQVEESAVKMHIEPLMTLICSALTEYVLHPMLEKENHPDPQSVVVWYDTTGLTMRPNRAQDAKDAHDRGALNTEALLDHLGFDSADAFDPTDEKQMKSFLIGLVIKNPTLLQDAAIAEMLGLPALTPPPAPAPAGGPQAVPDQEEDDDPLPEDTQDDDTVPQQAARIAATVTLALTGVQRALGLAGNRLRTRHNLQQLQGVPRHETHVKLRARPSVERAARLIDGWDEVLSGPALDAAHADRARLSALVRRKAIAALAECRPLGSIAITDDEAKLAMRESTPPRRVLTRR